MKKIYWALIGVLLIASFFRLYDLKNVPPGMYPDEAMNGNNALEAAATGEYKVFYSENNGREGLFINIQAWFFKFLPNEPWAARLPSALFGILTIPGVFFLTRELFRKYDKEVYKEVTEAEAIALLAAFLMAVGFWHINFSRIAFRAIMAPTFLVWSLYLFLLAIRKNKAGDSTSVFWAGAGGAIFGLGFHSYIAYRAMPLLMLLLIPFYYKKKGFWKLTEVFTLGVVIVGLPLGIYFWQNPEDFMGRTTQVSVFNSETVWQDLSVNIIKTAGMFNVAGDYNQRHNLAGEPLLLWPVGFFFLAGFILITTRGIFLKDKADRLNLTVILGIFVVAALPVVVSNEGMPHALRAIIMAPAVYILAGLGMVWFLKTIKKYTTKQVAMSLFIVTVIYAAGANWHKYFIEWGRSEATDGAFAKNYVDVGMELNEMPKETLKYVIVESGGVLVRGVPMPAQTVMFITDTFREEKQKEKNIFYVLPADSNKISKETVRRKI